MNQLSTWIDSKLITEQIRMIEELRSETWKLQVTKYTLGATVVAALTTRPGNDLRERAFCFRGEKDETFTAFEALSPSNETKPFDEIEEAADVNCAAAIFLLLNWKIRTPPLS